MDKICCAIQWIHDPCWRIRQSGCAALVRRPFLTNELVIRELLSDTLKYASFTLAICLCHLQAAPTLRCTENEDTDPHPQTSYMLAWMTIGVSAGAVADDMYCTKCCRVSEYANLLHQCDSGAHQVDSTFVFHRSRLVPGFHDDSTSILGS